MGQVEKIFKVVTPVAHSFSLPQRQSSEAVEDYSVKKVMNTLEGTIEKVPVNANDIVNKAYADSLVGTAAVTVEGSNVLSTGEAVTKWLRADGDGTSSWQALPAAGAVAWGDLTGTVSNQTDLQAELDGKVSTTLFNTVVGSVDNLQLQYAALVSTTSAYDTHIASSAIHFTEASIDHTAISNIGSNSHAAIDLFIASSLNPVGNHLSNANGNIGIGTASPYSPLTVFRNLNSISTVRLINNTTTADNTTGVGFGVTTSNIIKSAIAHQRKGSSGYGHLVFLVDPDTNGSDVTTSDEAMRIVGSTGNVGIGTNSPSSKLSVSGDISVTGNVDGVDVSTFKSSYDTHVASTAIHYAQASISIPASQISDFDTEVSNNTDVAAVVGSAHAQNTDTALGSNAEAQDHGTASTDMIVNVCYGTSATPPTANTTTIGTLYIQYTA